MIALELYSGGLTDWAAQDCTTYLMNKFNSNLFISVREAGSFKGYEVFLHWANKEGGGDGIKLYFYPDKGESSSAACKLCCTLLEHRDIPPFAFLDLMLDCIDAEDARRVEKYLEGFTP